MKKRIDRPIGEKFKKGNKTYTIVSSHDKYCFDCDFYGNPTLCEGVLCVHEFRKDNTEVIVKEVTEN